MTAGEVARGLRLSLQMVKCWGRQRSNQNWRIMDEEPKHNAPASKTSSEKPIQRRSKSEDAEDDSRLVEIIKLRNQEVGLPVNIDEL
jgi:hypothetical protein